MGTDPSDAPFPPPDAGVLPVSPAPCVRCGRPVKPPASFCSACGLRVGDSPPLERPRERLTVVRARLDREWGEIRSVIVLYVVLLGIQVVAALVWKATEEEFAVMAVADALMAVAVLVAAVGKRALVQPLYRRPGFGAAGYLAIAAVALPMYLLVHYFVESLGWAFHVRAERTLDAFEGRSPLWAVLMICVTPPLFEELAFRGVMHGILERRVRMLEVYFVTAFAFAILHLSVPSLATHVPMGLYFCFLRHRSGSLYPPMAAHALHNGLVLADEYFEVLPVAAFSS